MSPAIQLTQYQQEEARVKARFRLKRWARQTGKTFEDTREIAEDAHARKTQWVILSRGERQSKANVEQAAVHCKAYSAAAEVLDETWRGEEGEYRAARINLPNGSWIMGLPANPDTARGFSANVALDEFAFHKDSRKIWAALFPVITRGYQLRVTSTPCGKQNKFYDLDVDWSKRAADSPHYHVSALDIYTAVAKGLVLRNEDGTEATPEQLKEALSDEDAWAQEYLVEYLDEATAFIPYELIAACEDPELIAEPLWLPGLLAAAQEVHQIYLRTKVLPPSFEILGDVLRSAIDAEELYLGMDIARKRHYTVLWVYRRIAPKLDTVAVIRLKDVPFFIQKIVLFSLLAHPAMRRGCLDQTGLGRQLAEEATERFGVGKVEGIDFTAANKETLATGLKQQMEDRIPILPAEPYIRNSFHAIKRLPSLSGHFRFDAASTDAGHADEFWACALATHAAGASGPPAAGVSHDGYHRDWRASRESIMAGVGAGRTDDWRARHSRLWGPEHIRG